MPEVAESVDQTAAASESGAHEPTGGGSAAIIDDKTVNTDNSASANGEPLDQEQPSPELEQTRKELLRDYHGKTQKLSTREKQLESEWGSYKKDAETLYGIMEQPWFKKAMADEKARRSGNAADLDLSDDQFVAALSDKTAFTKMVRQVAESIAERKVGEKLSPAQEELQALKADREFQAVAAEHPDLKKLNQDGLLDEYLKQGYSYAVAYKLYKFDHQESAEQVERKAQELLQTKKAGSVEKTGVPKLNGAAKVYKAKTWDQAFDRAWEALQRGETDARIERE